MKVATHTRFMALSLVLLLVLSLVGATVAQDEPVKVIVTGLNQVGGDLETIDPGTSQTSSQIEIINQMFVGLTHQNNETAEIEPGVATGWEVEQTDAGAVYTFTLREGIPWVHYNAETGAVEQVMDENGEGRVVTAHDFVYAFKRTLDPATGGSYSYLLGGYVVGGNEFLAGEATADDVMVEAVDDYTLQVTSPEAVAFAPSIYGLWMARAVPSWTIEENGDLWTEPEYIATYGPFTLKEWAHDESITLVANPLWPATDEVPAPMIDEVVFRFLEQQAQFAEFLAGTMDAVEVPLEELERVKADPELSTQYSVGPNPCSYYVGFDTTEAPTDNVNLRRALSLAVDRQSIVENVTRGGQVGAQWFTYPGVNAAPTLETHPDLGIQYDPEAAQEALALAIEEFGVASAAELPTIILGYNDSSGHAAIMQAIQQMWTDTLSIGVQLQPMDPTTYFSGLREEAPMAFRAGWCQDYADANSYAYDVFHSSSEFNYSGWTSPEYDALVEEARVNEDTAARVELYAQAEEMLVDTNAAIMPIYWYAENQLTAPNVERSYSVTGNEYYYTWDVTE